MTERTRYQIIESESRTFTFRAYLPSQSIPPLGALVQVNTIENRTIFGVVYRTLVLRDDFLEQLSGLSRDEADQFFGGLDQFGVPVEVSVASVGYRDSNGMIQQSLPARPPVYLDTVTVCEQDEVAQFTRRLSYLYLLLDAVTDDKLIAEHIKLVAQAHPDRGEAFLLDVAREIARRLIYDPWRADRILSHLEQQ